MHFEPTAIAGAFIIHTAPQTDNRGSFTRTFCTSEFAAAGIAFHPVQLNLSRNPRAFTLRGLHGNQDPAAEAKIIQCTAGHIHDVAVDLRPASPTYLAHVGVSLPATGNTLFYIPPGCLHGFLTLTPNSDILYHMGTAFIPGTGTGHRWNDPAFAILWPAVPQIISSRDANYPDYTG